MTVPSSRVSIVETLSRERMETKGEVELAVLDSGAAEVVGRAGAEAGAKLGEA